MSFDVYSASTNEGSGNKKEIDFDALNKYVVETAQLQDRETLIGYVAGIVDLGTQEQEDASMQFNGDADDEAAEVEKYPGTYFEDGKDDKGKVIRLKRWKQKPIQSVAVAIDFPDIIIDKGQFFGESKPLPLRLWLGGTFYIEGTGMIVARPTPLKVNLGLSKPGKKDWSFDQKHLFYKMAVDSKLIKPGELFLPREIDKLLGKAFQFQAQVFFKESKGKEYFNEYIKYVGSLGRGQKEPELATTPFMVQFNQKNDPELLKEVRNHVINTIKRASNFEGSAIQKQLDEIGKGGSVPTKKQEAQPEPEKPAPKAVKPAKPVKPVVNDFEDDIPF